MEAYKALQYYREAIEDNIGIPRDKRKESSVPKPSREELYDCISQLEKKAAAITDSSKSEAQKALASHRERLKEVQKDIADQLVIIEKCDYKNIQTGKMRNIIYGDIDKLKRLATELRYPIEIKEPTYAGSPFGRSASTETSAQHWAKEGGGEVIHEYNPYG